MKVGSESCCFEGKGWPGAWCEWPGSILGQACSFRQRPSASLTRRSCRGAPTAARRSSQCREALCATELQRGLPQRAAVQTRGSGAADGGLRCVGSPRCGTAASPLTAVGWLPVARGCLGRVNTVGCFVNGLRNLTFPCPFVALSLRRADQRGHHRGPRRLSDGPEGPPQQRPRSL